MTSKLIYMNAQRRNILVDAGYFLDDGLHIYVPVILENGAIRSVERYRYRTNIKNGHLIRNYNHEIAESQDIENTAHFYNSSETKLHIQATADLVKLLNTAQKKEKATIQMAWAYRAKNFADNAYGKACAATQQASKSKDTGQPLQLLQAKLNEACEAVIVTLRNENYEKIVLVAKAAELEEQFDANKCRQKFASELTKKKYELTGWFDQSENDYKAEYKKLEEEFSIAIEKIKKELASIERSKLESLNKEITSKASTFEALAFAYSAFAFAVEEEITTLETKEREIKNTWFKRGLNDVQSKLKEKRNSAYNDRREAAILREYAANLRNQTEISTRAIKEEYTNIQSDIERQEQVIRDLSANFIKDGATITANKASYRIVHGKDDRISWMRTYIGTDANGKIVNSDEEEAPSNELTDDMKRSLSLMHTKVMGDLVKSGCFLDDGMHIYLPVVSDDGTPTAIDCYPYIAEVEKGQLAWIFDATKEIERYPFDSTPLFFNSGKTKLRIQAANDLKKTLTTSSKKERATLQLNWEYRAKLFADKSYELARQARQNAWASGIVEAQINLARTAVVAVLHNESYKDKKYETKLAELDELKKTGASQEAIEKVIAEIKEIEQQRVSERIGLLEEKAKLFEDLAQAYKTRIAIEEKEVAACEENVQDTQTAWVFKESRLNTAEIELKRKKTQLQNDQEKVEDAYAAAQKFHSNATELAKQNPQVTLPIENTVAKDRNQIAIEQTIADQLLENVTTDLQMPSETQTTEQPLEKTVETATTPELDSSITLITQPAEPTNITQPLENVTTNEQAPVKPQVTDLQIPVEAQTTEQPLEKTVETATTQELDSSIALITQPAEPTNITQPLENVTTNEQVPVKPQVTDLQIPVEAQTTE